VGEAGQIDLAFRAFLDDMVGRRVWFRASSLMFGLLLGSLFAGPAVGQTAPRCELRGQPHLEGRVRGTSPTARAVDARLGQELEIFLIMPGLFEGRPVIFAEDGAAGHVSYLRSGCQPLIVSWSRIEPRMAHKETPSPNPDVRVYSNAVIFGPRHGKWLGYDALEYVETPVKDESAPSLIVRDARPAIPAAPRPAGHENLGTLRLAATLRQGSTELSTPGVSLAARGQIDGRVFRYSFRSDDGFIGWLTSYYNVPYLFGSAGDGPQNQAERYIGADCADVLVAALRRAGLPRLRYTNVTGVIDAVGRRKVETDIKACPPPLSACTQLSEPPLRFGSDVNPGDILAVNYLGDTSIPRALDHILVLVEDSGPDGKPDGVLGPHDLVADTGDELGLKFARLADQGAVHVVFARPRNIPAF
jgi:hypothetical protein